MPWDILEGRSRDGKLKAGKFSSCKAIVISITDIQSTAVQRGSVYTLPTSSLHSSRNGTRRWWHHGPQVWTIPQLLPFGSLQLGQKGYRAALPRAVPALSAWTVLQETTEVLPCTEHQPPPGPNTPDSTVPGPCTCSCTSLAATTVPGLQRCSPSGHHCTQTDPMIFTFTLTDLSPASNNRPGGALLIN